MVSFEDEGMSHLHIHDALPIIEVYVSNLEDEIEGPAIMDGFSFDTVQEIARSSFGDMLHDSERNYKYYEGLQQAIDKFHNRGMKANVLDIGTGTGLLSMMAAKCGADAIVACEAFKPIACCAVDVIQENGFENMIKVVSKHSTDITVGNGGDLPYKFNILVAEVFDTELIGEGAISVFKHAHEKLLEEDCLVVPDRAAMYCQVIESPWSLNWADIGPVKYGDEDLLDVPKEMRECPGSFTVLHDIQLSQFPRHKFQPISEPTLLFSFCWSGKEEIQLEYSASKEIVASKNGRAQVLFVWWDLMMDTEGKVIISCAPEWAHPDRAIKTIPWRDHWIQAVYFLPKAILADKGSSFKLSANYNEYSMFFELEEVDTTAWKGNFCECLGHLLQSRSRIGAGNDLSRTAKYLTALQEVVGEGAVCMCVGDGMHLGMAAVQMGARHVFLVESTASSRGLAHQWISQNVLKDSVTIVQGHEKEKFPLKVDILFGEPFFYGALLPWDNLTFWAFRQEVSRYLGHECQTIPGKAVLWCVPVEFDHLWKIRAPVVSVEGFTLTAFDEYVQEAVEKVDSNIEPQPLWEYSSTLLRDKFEIAQFDFTTDFPESFEIRGTRTAFTPGTCHAVVVWIDWHLNTDITITTGLYNDTSDNKSKWDVYNKQGVYFFPIPQKVKCTSVMSYKCKMNSGKLTFEFNIEKDKRS